MSSVDAAQKRKMKRKPASDVAANDEDPSKLTPDEESIAKALLWELPGREGKLAGMTVKIFFANEALDFLLASRFSKPSKASQEPLIRDEKAATRMLANLMDKGLFQRAAKIQKEKRARPAKDKKQAIGSGEAPATEEEEKRQKEREEKRQKEREEKRRRGKPRLDIHEMQEFSPLPGEVYIWHYDPTRPRNVVLGLLLVIGSILLCLFPMWPVQLRTGTYYLSIGALCLLGGLIALALARFPLYGLVWCLTCGRLKFWFLPNLTEDVGVLESFVPVVSFDWAAWGAPEIELKKTE